jgi:molybdopterin converting factor subunit 1
VSDRSAGKCVERIVSGGTICWLGLQSKVQAWLWRLAYSFWMRVRVLYFGVLKDLMGCDRTEMVLRDGLSVAGLVEVHRGLAAALVWDSIAVAVNQEYARGEDVLKDGDEVGLLPPVSGGSEDCDAS